MKTTDTTTAQKIGFCQIVVAPSCGIDGRAIDQAIEFGVGLRRGHVADDDGDEDADQPAPQRAITCSPPSAARREKARCARAPAPCARRCPCWCRRTCQSRTTVPASRPRSRRLCGALPQHAQDHRAEQRRDKEAEQRLHVVHDRGGVRDQVGRADGDQHAHDCGRAAHRRRSACRWPSCSCTRRRGRTSIRSRSAERCRPYRT